MRFSLFYQLPCADDQSQVTRYRETIEQVEHGDALGFHCAWLAELHFFRPFSIMSSPLIVATAIAQRTETIRLGIAVNLLPLWHPLRSAEDAATVDLLSNGRLEFGVGRGGIPLHFAGFGASRAEGRERFEEALEIIRRAWTRESFSYQGKFYEIPETSVVPKPLQKPHPPFRVAANSPETALFAGHHRYPMLVASVTNPLPRMAKQVARYREAWASAEAVDSVGSQAPDISTMFFVHPGENLSAVQDDIEPSLDHYFRSVKEMGATTDAASGAESYGYMKEVRETLAQLNFASVTREMAVFGSPTACVEKIAVLKEQLGMQEMLCWFNPGGRVPHERVKRAMTRFAEEVMPAFAD